MDDDGLSLTPEEEAEFFALLRRAGEYGPLERADLNAVTRRFLEDVLSEADIPEELLDRIVEVYRARGHLMMTPDGRRYIITLT